MPEAECEPGLRIIEVKTGRIALFLLNPSKLNAWLPGSDLHISEQFLDHRGQLYGTRGAETNRSCVHHALLLAAGAGVPPYFSS